jgi:hypothetical protein
MDLNDLLNGKGINPESVLVFRHRPTEPRLCKALPWLAAEKPDVFNAYQQTQGEKVEKAMTSASYVASFIGHTAGKALFIGLYAIDGSEPLTREDYWRIPANVELQRLGVEGFTENTRRSSVLWFDLRATTFYSHWKGKLVVDWPSPERSWWRRAHRNTIPVNAILEDSALDADMPDWDRLVLTWDELRIMPTRWRAVLSQWRGVYFIFDTSDGRGYVGSAYGADNLLGRWLNYAASGHGGNALLRNRDAIHFSFSILQRVSPDLDPEEVIRLEGTWKDRLHTRDAYGLNEN